MQIVAFNITPVILQVLTMSMKNGSSRHAYSNKFKLQAITLANQVGSQCSADYGQYGVSWDQCSACYGQCSAGYGQCSTGYGQYCLSWDQCSVWPV